MPSDVTVIIPAYNAARYLGETLCSVLAQTVRPDAILVCDDASTDDTVRVAESFAPYVTVIRSESNSGGCSIPRNRAITRASTRWIVPFDADDIMEPRKIQRCLETAERFPQAEFVFTDFVCFGSDPARVPPGRHCHLRTFFRSRLQPPGGSPALLTQTDAFESLLRENYIGAGAVMYTRGLWTQVGGYDTSLSSAEDMDFWFRAARVADFAFVDEPLHRYRIHAGAKSARRVNNLGCAIRALEKNLRLPMTHEGERALRHQIAEMEVELAWQLSKIEKDGEALRHWWKAARSNGLTRPMLRHSRKLALHFARRAARRCFPRRTTGVA